MHSAILGCVKLAVRPIALKLVVLLPAGLVLTVASVWLPMLIQSWRSAVPTCSRAWVVDPNRIGTVLEDNYNWWLPIDKQRASVRKGSLVRKGDDNGVPSAHYVQFTDWDTWAAPVAQANIHDGAPTWARAWGFGSEQDVVEVVRVTGGWPFRSLEGFMVGKPWEPKGVVHDKKWLFSGYELPCWPLFGNLAMSMLTWSLFAMGVSTSAAVAFRSVLAKVRRSKGLCGRCAYPNRRLPAERCPECGHSMTTH